MTGNEKNSATAMSDNEIIKASGEVSFEKIKAICPHIVVSGDIDKPYYSIQYYDIEKKTMFDCYGSYKLRFVRKWLEELFEVIEPDIAGFINRLQTQNEALIAGHETLQKALADEIAKGNICAEVIARQDKEIAKYKADIKELNTIRSRLIYDGDTYTKITDELYQKIKSEATKEFAESYTENFITLFDLNYSQAEAARKLKERVVKEMVGEG